MNLLLFTGSYPYDFAVEQHFLTPEIEALAAGFDRVILFPQVCRGERLPLPKGVELVEDFAAFHTAGNRLRSLLCVPFSPLLRRELFTRPRLLAHPSALSRLVSFLGGAYLAQAWLEKWLKAAHLDPADCIFYTYWFDYAAMGIGLARRRHPQLRLVSRVHGYDLFEERYSPPYWPCRPAALAALDGLFSVSAAGAAYLARRYPAVASRIEVARLGVADPAFLTPASADGVFRLASCSIIRPVKRLELLLEGLAEAARQRPGQRFEWRHIGISQVEGVRQALQQRADALLPPNARAFFPGYSSHAALMEAYRTSPVDAFANVSVSEGTPVSTMEALSCGIPVIATAVGGNAETVSEANGILLPPDPLPAQIAAAFFRCLDSPAWASAARSASRALWNERYNSALNFNAFVRRLIALRTGAGPL